MRAFGGILFAVLLLSFGWGWALVIFALLILPFAIPAALLGLLVESWHDNRQ
jgi:ABC-type sugar transport system permease subunit